MQNLSYTESRLTIVSHETRKKQATCDKQMRSYIHVPHSTTLKFVNALEKPQVS